jgi:hypothetical protein
MLRHWWGNRNGILGENHGGMDRRARNFWYWCDFLEGSFKKVLGDLQGGNKFLGLILKGEFDGGVNDRLFEIFG